MHSRFLINANLKLNSTVRTKHAYLGKGCSFDILRSYDHAWVDNHIACSSGSHAQSLEKLVNLSLTYQLRMLTSKFKTSNGREIVPLRRHSKYMSIIFARKIILLSYNDMFDFILFFSQIELYCMLWENFKVNG